MPKSLCAGVAALSLALSVHAASAETFKVLHTFTGGTDGSTPESQVFFDPETSKIYGTTKRGGDSANVGTVYEDARFGDAYKVVHRFGGSLAAQGDGANPLGGVVVL